LTVDPVNNMADDSVLAINALLCFVLYSYKKQPLKFLSSIVSDFYTIEVISEAKERLVNDVECLKLDKWTRPPTRRGDNKRKHDLEDIMTQISLLDEGGFISKLPKYVVDNLDNIPLVRMERGEFAVLVSKLDKISDELSCTRLATVSTGGHCPTDPLNTGGALNLPTVVNNDIQRVRQWGASAESDLESSDGAWEMKSRRRKGLASSPSPRSKLNVRGKKLYSAALVGEGTSASNIASYQSATIPSQSASVAPSRVAPPRSGAISGNIRTSRSRVRVIGKSKDSSGFHAAKPYVKKAVYALYNVDRNESVETLTDFVSNTLKVSVLSCFETNLLKPNRFTKSFRLCINARDNVNLLIPDKWCDGIVIRKWRFGEKGNIAAASAASDSDSQIGMDIPGGGFEMAAGDPSVRASALSPTTDRLSDALLKDRVSDPVSQRIDSVNSNNGCV
jgi:hypothetical protein